MDAAKNPFAPGAGTEPPELTGRTNNLEHARVALERIKHGRSAQSSLLIGLRGVGKTVLLNRIERNARNGGYFVIAIEAPEDVPLGALLAPHLREVLLKIDRIENAKDKARKALAGLMAFAATFHIKYNGFEFGIKPEPGVADSGSFEKDLTDLFVLVGEAAQAANTSVGIFVDELQYVRTPEMAALIAALHRISQLNLPIILFGAGLPQLTGLTGKAKTYAERLFKFENIGQLNISDASAAIRGPIQQAGALIDNAALDRILEATEGYPYFLQVWGQQAWNIATGNRISRTDVAHAEVEVIKSLDQSFFRVRFDRLTKGEKEYIRAMAELGSRPHRSGDIARALGRKVDSVAPIRSHAIAKGMIYSPSYGDNAFTVPHFDLYMRRVMPDFNIKVKKTVKKNKVIKKVKLASSPKR